MFQFMINTYKPGFAPKYQRGLCEPFDSDIHDRVLPFLFLKSTCVFFFLFFFVHLHTSSKCSTSIGFEFSLTKKSLVFAMSSIFYGWQTLNEPQGTVLQQITGYGLKPQGLLIVNSAWCRAHTRDSLKESLNTILYTHHILLILNFFFQFSFSYKIC